MSSQIRHIGRFGVLYISDDESDDCYECFAWELMIQPGLLEQFTATDQMYIHAIAKLELDDTWYQSNHRQPSS